MTLPATPPLIVLGASAGGVEALVELVGGIDADLSAAVLVTVHTGERPTTGLPAVLARAGPLPAEHAEPGMPLRAGRIAVAPPDRHLIVSGGSIALSVGPRVNRHRPAVDVMFAAAARSHGRRAVAAVLSGTLDDGAAGAAVVHRAGGLVAVQDPDDALFASMPRAVLHTVPSALVAPARELGALLSKLVTDLPAGGDDVAHHDPSAPGQPSMADSAEPAFLRPDESVVTRMACPECGGALAGIDLPRLRYYRCHVGHQFSPQSLELAQRESAEAKLWAAVAALEEHAAMARHLAAERARDEELRAAAEHSAAFARAVARRLRGEPDGQ